MTRIDFYQLDQQRHRTEDVVCRLCAKAYAQKQNILVLTEDHDHSEQLDQVMWIFEDDSFLPHDIEESEGFRTPVLIHNNPGAVEDREILINLSTSIPDFFPQFERVLELVTEHNRDSARERYRYYKDRGYELHHHNL